MKMDSACYNRVSAMRLTPKIHKAIIRASLLHNEKKRKADGFPYIIHPFSVALIVAQCTENEDTIVAALLHDVLEDVPEHIYTAAQMKRDFGNRVYETVREVSEEKIPAGSLNRETAWKKKKENYIENLRGASHDALIIACADKIHNIRSLIDAYEMHGASVWNKFTGSKEQMMWFFGNVLRILREKLNCPIVEELEQLYVEARQLFGTGEGGRA